MRRLRRAYQRNNKKKHKKFKQKAVAAGTAAAITFGIAASSNRGSRTLSTPLMGPSDATFAVRIYIWVAGKLSIQSLT